MIKEKNILHEWDQMCDDLLNPKGQRSLHCDVIVFFKKCSGRYSATAEEWQLDRYNHKAVILVWTMFSKNIMFHWSNQNKQKSAKCLSIPHRSGAFIPSFITWAGRQNLPRLLILHIHVLFCIKTPCAAFYHHSGTLGSTQQACAVTQHPSSSLRDACSSSRGIMGAFLLFLFFSPKMSSVAELEHPSASSWN